MSDSNGNETGFSNNFDIHSNSSPAFYTSFALVKSETEPFCTLTIYSFRIVNGDYVGEEFHSRFGRKRNKKVSHNFW